MATEWPSVKFFCGMHSSRLLTVRPHNHDELPLTALTMHQNSAYDCGSVSTYGMDGIHGRDVEIASSGPTAQATRPIWLHFTETAGMQQQLHSASSMQTPPP